MKENFKIFNDKKVFIAGASGFIGSNLVHTLLQLGAEVHTLVRREIDFTYLKIPLNNLFIHQSDIRNEKEIEKIIKKINPDYIFNVAVIYGHSSLDKANEVLEVSILGTANLINACSKTDFSGFVQFGSSLEYGPKDKPINENERLNPTTLRGVAKASATLLCLQFGIAENRPITVIRPFSVYGPFENQNRLIPTAINAAIYDKPLNLTAKDYFRDMVYVSDVVESCLLSAATGIVGEVFNIGSGVQNSNLEIIKTVEEVTGKTIAKNIGKYQPSPCDTDNWVADISKANDVLGWQPKVSLREGISQYWELMKNESA